MGTCRRCKKPLIAASPVDREGKSDGIRLRAYRLPVRRCPAGCPGTYWGQPDLAAKLFEALTGNAEWVLPRRLFGRSCPRCGGSLSNSAHPGRLRAVILQPSGAPTVLEIHAPVLDCDGCGISFLDAAGQVETIRDAVIDLLESNLLRLPVPEQTPA